jgi:uncharacterized protein YbbK (DUF523 family)/uncharacterized protein YbgA (DUF1722 family)
VVSRCLDLAPCRYNGAVIETPFVRRLQAHVDLLPVCPELEVGLGVPRAPIRLVRRGGATVLVQPATGCDLTRAMGAFAEGFLESLPEVDAFLLKARSPSCGVHGVKVFPDADTDAPQGREIGMFARAVLSRFPDLPAEHEGRLGNPRLLDRFLTRLFALADLRNARAPGSLDALLELHERYGLTRRTFLAEHAATLDRIVGSAVDAGAPAEAWQDYADALRAALVPVPRESAHVHAILEAARALAGAAPRAELDGLLARYRQGAAPRWKVLAGLRRLLAEGDSKVGFDPYLAPYPEELVLTA